MSGLLVISDLHAHAWPLFAETTSDGLNSRFNDLINVLAQVDSLIMQHKPEHVAILGDLTHRRQYVQFSVYARLVEWLHRVVDEHRARVIVMVGNHDIETHGYHSLMPLRFIHGITVIDQPTWIETTLGWSHFIPYMHHGVVEAARNATHVGTAFLHYALDGKTLDNNYRVPSALTLTDLDEYDRVVFGHIHAPAIEHGDRVIYVGAPLHFDFGDKGDRYAWLFTGIGGPAEQFTLNFPKFVTATYPRVPVCANTLGGFLRVLDVPRDEMHDVVKSARGLGWTGVRATPHALAHEHVRTLSLERSSFASEESVRAFVLSRFVDHDEAYRERLVGYGVSLMQRASE